MTDRIVIEPGDYVEYWTTKTENFHYVTGDSKVVTTTQIKRLRVNKVKEYQRILLQDKDNEIVAEYGGCKFLIKNAFSENEKSHPMCYVEY